MADLGPERPGHASDTRRMSEADRVMHTDRVSGRAFWIVLAMIIVAVVVVFAVR